MPDDDPYIIQLWGGTAVGKTSLLTAAFGNIRERSEWFPSVDFGSPETDVTRWEKEFRMMSKGIAPPGTSENDWEATSLKTSLHIKPNADSGPQSLKICDIRGDSWRERTAAERAAFFSRRNQAVLFVVPWQLNQIPDAMTDVHAAMEYLKNSAPPCGLAFTKCDQLSTEYSRALSNAASTEQRKVHEAWAACHDPVAQHLYSHHRELIIHFHCAHALWLTTVWGWEEERKKPALTLNEFGHVVPCRIRPVGVARPLRFLINKLFDHG